MAPPKMHAKTISLITRVFMFTVPNPGILASLRVDFQHLPGFAPRLLNRRFVFSSQNARIQTPRRRWVRSLKVKTDYPKDYSAVSDGFRFRFRRIHQGLQKIFVRSSFKCVLMRCEGQAPRNTLLLLARRIREEIL